MNEFTRVSRPTRPYRTATVPIIGNFHLGLALRQMLLPQPNELFLTQCSTIVCA